MVPPIPKILTVDDWNVSGGFSGFVTISSTERVNNWNNKVLKKFKKLVNNSDEAVLNNIMDEYYRMLNDQVTYLKERHLLKEKIADHLYSLHLSYVRLQEQALIKTSHYLDNMEKLLCLFCNLQLEVISSTMNTSVVIVAQGMIYMLQIYLFDQITRILHVLLKLSERYANKEPYQKVMDFVYKYFLITIPVINTADLNFCLHYLLYQKWKIAKSENTCMGMDRLMFFTFNKTPETFKDSRLLRKILKPTSNEITNGIDTYINCVDSKIIQYFKYFDQTKEMTNNNSDETDSSSKKCKSDDPYEIEFLQSTLYIKTLNHRNEYSNAHTLMDVVPKKQDAVIIIDDEDDSDIEMVPVGQNEESSTLTPLLGEISLSVQAPLDTPNNKTPADASKLKSLFDSVTIANIKDLNIENGDYMLCDKDKSENLDVLKLMMTMIEKLCSKAQGNENQFNVTEGKDSYTQKLGTVKSQVKEAACSSTSNDIMKNHSEMELKETTVKTNDDSGDIQTNGNLDRCCSCQHSPKKQIHNVQPYSKEVELGPTPAYKNVEIQTDTGVTVTNVCTFRGIIETPPSDLENFHSPSMPFINPPDGYVKEDSYLNISEHYSEVDSITPKYGDTGTQVYPNLIDAVDEVNHEDIVKTQNESFDNYGVSPPDQSFPSTSTASDFRNCNESEDLCMNINEFLKMPVLEPELDGKSQQNENSNNAPPSVSSDTSLDTNNTTTTIPKRKIVAAIDIKTRITNNKKRSPKVRKRTNAANNPVSGVDKLNSHPNVLTDTNGVNDSTDLTARENSPSPAYEAIPAHELRKQLKEVTRRKRKGILKNSNSIVDKDGEFYSNVNTATALKRSPISTRASSKRKSNACEEVVPKAKKVNFAETDIVVHTSNEQHRKISHSVVEQAKDSMCVHNIHKQDNKLIYLECCIPISVEAFSKFLETDKLRQINTFQKMNDNLFFKKPAKVDSFQSIQRIDYKKSVRIGESSTSVTPPKYSTISLCEYNESASSSATTADGILGVSNAELCDADEIIQNAINFYVNANLTCDLDLTLCSKTYKSLIKYLIDFDTENNAIGINDTDVAKVEVRIPHSQSSYEKYQEKEMPIKKRRVPTSPVFTPEENYTISEDVTNSEGSLTVEKKILKINNAFPSNVELVLVLNNCTENTSDEMLVDSENLIANNISDSTVTNSETYIEESYPAGPVISIAEIPEDERNQNRTFKTPAERKEFPALSTYCYPTDPTGIFSEASAPIITDQFNVNNHTYNNPTINYHVPLPYYNMPYYPVASYILPYNGLQLDSSSSPSNPSSYNNVVKQSTVVDNVQASCAMLKKEKKTIVNSIQ